MATITRSGIILLKRLIGSLIPANAYRDAQGEAYTDGQGNYYTAPL